YARTQPNGPGLPLDEKRVDYQDYLLYAEHLLGERLSLFGEVPFRAANFEVNANHSGLGDSNFGGKYAFIMTPDTVATAQFRTYVPTGAASRGLGNHHVSLEPALLFWHQLAERWVTEGEFRVWVPVGGTPGFAGDLVRYGLGLRYNVVQTEKWILAPVGELV